MKTPITHRLLKFCVSSFLAASLLRAQEDPAAARFGMPELLEGDHITGNWFGSRDRLEEIGIDFFGSYTAEVWGNVSGGERRGAVYTGLLDFGVTLNMEKLVGWQGASVHNSWLWLSGQDPSERLLGGDFFAASNIAGFDTFRMFELWFQQTLFEDAVSLRVGQLAADEEFAISGYAELFLGGTFGFPLALTESFPNGGPQYPLATPGVRLELNPSEWFTFRAAAFQGDPFAEDVNRHGFRYRLDRRIGYLFLNEADVRWGHLGAAGLPGNFKAGAWFHTADFADPADEAIERRGNTGFYFILDQALYRPASPAMNASHVGGKSTHRSGKSGPLAAAEPDEESAAGLGTFTRFAFEPADRNEISFYFDAGLVYQGLLPGRPDDSLGVALGYGKLSRGAVGALREDGASKPGYSMVLEATYQAQITPWLAVQPDLQYILRPGGTSDFPNALVLGLRSTVEF